MYHKRDAIISWQRHLLWEISLPLDPGVLVDRFLGLYRTSFRWLLWPRWWFGRSQILPQASWMRKYYASNSVWQISRQVEPFLFYFFCFRLFISLSLITEKIIYLCVYSLIGWIKYCFLFFKFFNYEKKNKLSKKTLFKWWTKILILKFVIAISLFIKLLLKFNVYYQIINRRTHYN